MQYLIRMNYLQHTMPEDEDFFIVYENKQIVVSPVLNKGNIYFIVHLKPDVIVAEGMVNEEWVWYEADKGETPLALALGTLIESVDE